MRCLRPLILVVVAGYSVAQKPAICPDAQHQTGCAQGKGDPAILDEQGVPVFPGTTRDYWTYVPSQYDASKPSPVMMFQEGGDYVREDGPWRAVTVLDNLIHNKELPAMIALFINPGRAPASNR